MFVSEEQRDNLPMGYLLILLEAHGVPVDNAGAGTQHVATPMFTGTLIRRRSNATEVE